MVTNGNIQFTSMTGGLSNHNLESFFVSGSESNDNTLGVTISGVMPNSTASDNMNNTRTNVNSGLNTSSGKSFNTKQWNDINGDGLTDKVTITKTQIIVNLNTGYGFTDGVIWNSDIPLQDINVSERSNLGSGSGIKFSASFSAGFGLAT